MTDRIKVAFPISEEHGQIERMFAQPLGERRYILDNSPFYVFDISYCDEFIANEIDGELVFSHIFSRGGHSTYRIKLGQGKRHSYFLRFWQQLAEAGCTYEGSSTNAQRLYAIDIPPGVDINRVYQLMNEYEENSVWSFEEGHYFNGNNALT